MKNSFISENKFLRKISVAIFWILLWEILSLLIGEEILLVSPFNALKKLLELIQTKSYWISIFSSLYKILLGMILSIVFGIMLAVLSFLFLPVREIIYPFISFLRAVPVASFVIFLLVWINVNHLSIFISFFMGMPIVYENIFEGLISVDKKLIEMAESFDVGTKKRFKYIYKIKTSPYLKAAIISISGLCFKAGVAAEVIGLQKNSIGENLYNSKIYLNMPELFAWTITILVLSMIFEKGIKILLGGKNAGI